MTTYRRDSFKLEANGTCYQLSTSYPDNHDAGPLSALLCLDSDDQFDTLCKARASLTRQGKVQPLLLAGVGYGASYREPANQRVRDYTSCPIEGAAQGGGEEAFLAFLTGTLWTELGKRFPLRNDVRGLAGHSLGALFALSALFRPDPFFNRVLASAPSLWWADGRLLNRIHAFRSGHSRLDADLFLDVGLKDSASMISDLDRLEHQLMEQPFTGLKISRERFPLHDHYNVLGVAFRAGLAALFPAKG